MFAKRNAALGFILSPCCWTCSLLEWWRQLMPKLISDFMGGNTARASEISGLNQPPALMQFFLPRSSVALGPSWPAARDPDFKFRAASLHPPPPYPASHTPPPPPPWSLDTSSWRWAPNIRWLFLGECRAGIHFGEHSTATAYISDVRLQKAVKGILACWGGIWVSDSFLGPALGGGRAVCHRFLLDRLRGSLAERNDGCLC